MKTLKPQLIQDLGAIYNIKSKKPNYYGIYECPICLNHYKTQHGSIKNKSSTKCKSCAAKLKKQATTHGLRNTRIYGIFHDIKKRCYNSNSKYFKNYGKRGIIICDEWLKDFKAFYDWALDNGYSDDLTIDRINNDGDYQPDNCRWTTKSIQSMNTRRLRSSNTSGYRGVHYGKHNDKWIARIGIEGKRIHLGVFKTALEAAIAYDKYIKENNLEHTPNGLL